MFPIFYQTIHFWIQGVDVNICEVIETFQNHDMVKRMAGIDLISIQEGVR